MNNYKPKKIIEGTMGVTTKKITERLEISGLLKQEVSA